MKKNLIYFFALANLLVTLVFWFAGSGSYLSSGVASKEFIAFGRLFGLLGEIFILINLVMIGRIKIIESTWGFDNLNKFHRWIGYSLAGVLVLHPVFLTIGYALLSHRSFSVQFVSFLTNWEDVFRAMIGLVILLIVVGVSVAIVRKKLRYETWYFIHLLMYVAVALFFGHQVQTGDLSSGAAFHYWYAINFLVFGLVILYRFLKPIYLFSKHSFTVKKIVQENSSVFSIYISGKNMQDFHFDAGQYANLTFLKKGMWYTHPFSFSSAYNSKNIRFTVKNLGDFTSKIFQIPIGTKVFLDGPLGVFTAKQAITNNYLLIAGGIGVTPLVAMAQSLKSKNINTDFIYAVQNKTDLVFLSEIKTLGINPKVILSKPDENTEGYETGFLDLEKIKRMSPDFLSRDIYICGPIIMMKFVNEILLEAGMKKEQIHFEKFAY